MNMHVTGSDPNASNMLLMYICKHCLKYARHKYTASMILQFILFYFLTTTKIINKLLFIWLRQQ